MTGVLFEIREFSLFDGPGIRTTVFLKGCPLRCVWCHNPEGISPKPRILFHAKSCSGCGTCRTVCPLLQKKITADGAEKRGRFEAIGEAGTAGRGETDGWAKTDGVAGTDGQGETGGWGGPVPDGCRACGRCAASCPNRARRLCGRSVESEELAAELLRQADLYRQSGGGVTFSGGEPLLQAEFVREVTRKLRDNGVSVAIETSGFAAAEVYQKTIAAVDLVYQDLKHPTDTDHRKWTNVSNVPIFENLTFLKASGKPFIVRIPVVPTANDSPETLEAFARLLADDAKNLLRVELLPYHAVGGGKYSLLGQKPPILPAEKPIPPEATEPFRRRGLVVRIL